MLMLTRRPGETIMIGDKISITVCKIQGNQVYFGIDAPKNVPVHRIEVYYKVNGQKAKNFE
jgi:carbon storage regulator